MNITTLLGFGRMSGEHSCAYTLKEHLPMTLLQNKPIPGDGEIVKTGELNYPTGNYVDALDELDTDVVFISTVGNFANELGEINKHFPTVLQLGQNPIEFMVVPTAQGAVGDLYSIMNNVDAIVAPSQYAKDNAEAMGLRNVVHIPGPIDTEQYDIADGNSTDIIMAGRIEPVKNFAAPLLAMPTLKREDVNIAMSVFGHGSLENKYKKIVQKIGLGSRVKFFGYKDLTEIYAQGRVFVQPSISEMKSRTLSEAMSAGLPCVASDIGGHHIGDGITHVEHDSIKEYRDALAKLITDDDYWQEMHEKVLESCKRFDVRNVADDYMKLFKNLDNLDRFKQEVERED